VLSDVVHGEVMGLRQDRSGFPPTAVCPNEKGKRDALTGSSSPCRRGSDSQVSSVPIGLPHEHQFFFDVTVSTALTCLQSAL
jgi:hypothetical protein